MNFLKKRSPSTLTMLWYAYVIMGMGGKERMQRRELESLLGHAATVIYPGRAFVHHLIELVAVFQCDDHWIRLNPSTYSDLMWWRKYMEGWNGISPMLKLVPMESPLRVNASGL